MALLAFVFAIGASSGLEAEEKPSGPRQNAFNQANMQLQSSFTEPPEHVDLRKTTPLARAYATVKEIEAWQHSLVVFLESAILLDARLAGSVVGNEKPIIGENTLRVELQKTLQKAQPQTDVRSNKVLIALEHLVRINEPLEFVAEDRTRMQVDILNSIMSLNFQNHTQLSFVEKAMQLLAAGVAIPMRLHLPQGLEIFDAMEAADVGCPENEQDWNEEYTAIIGYRTLPQGKVWITQSRVGVGEFVVPMGANSLCIESEIAAFQKTLNGLAGPVKLGACELFHNDVCVASCPDGTLQRGNECIQCEILYGGYCIAACPPLTLRNGNTCEPCQLLSAGQCVTECPPGKTIKGNQCVPCRLTSTGICSACEIVYNDSCVFYCPTGLNSTSNKCNPHDGTCPYTYQGICHYKCPEGTRNEGTRCIIAKDSVSRNIKESITLGLVYGSVCIVVFIITMLFAYHQGCRKLMKISK